MSIASTVAALGVLGAMALVGCSSSNDSSALCEANGGVCMVGPTSGCTGYTVTTSCSTGSSDPAGGFCCLPCPADGGTVDGGACGTN